MRPGRKGGGINWEIGIDIYTLLHIKWLEKRKIKCRETWIIHQQQLATRLERDSWNQSGKEFGLGQRLL